MVMLDEKTTPPATPQPEAQDVQQCAQSDTNIIPPGEAVCQGPVAAVAAPAHAHQKGVLDDDDKKKARIIGIDTAVYSLAIKCYEEQLPLGEQATMDAVMSLDNKRYHVIAIKHDQDTVTDGIWAEAAVKHHYHVIVRCTDKQDRFRVKNMLNNLHIHFRPGTDDKLWLNHGVETVRNYAGYALYLTHETQDAINDGKHLYPRSDLIANITDVEIDAIREGYLRLTAAANRKIDMATLAALDKEAYDLGYKLDDITPFIDAQPLGVRSHPKFKTILQSYHRGTEARLRESRDIMRVCVYIQGPPNTGKTYTSGQVLQQFGERVLHVGGGGTGKFDSLRPDHGAIVIDDDVCPNLLNMTDNYICRAYRRNSNNPVWAGRYLIVTGNDPFDLWLGRCGIKINSPNHDAVLSRFFRCHIDGRRLVLDYPSWRGSITEQAARLSLYENFEAAYNAAVASYQGGGEDEDALFYLVASFQEREAERLLSLHDEYRAEQDARYEEWAGAWADAGMRCPHDYGAGRACNGCRFSGVCPYSAYHLCTWSNGRCPCDYRDVCDVPEDRRPVLLAGCGARVY